VERNSNSRINNNENYKFEDHVKNLRDELSPIADCSALERMPSGKLTDFLEKSKNDE
jgi:hypothetical protein